MALHVSAQLNTLEIDVKVSLIRQIKLETIKYGIGGSGTALQGYSLIIVWIIIVISIYAGIYSLILLTVEWFKLMVSWL